MTAPKGKSNPVRFAQIVKDIKSNGVYFKYTNGMPGDVINLLHNNEIKTYEEIVKKLNLHAKLVRALEVEHQKSSVEEGSICGICALLQEARGERRYAAPKPR